MVRIVTFGKGDAMGYDRCSRRTFVVVSAYVQFRHVRCESGGDEK